MKSQQLTQCNIKNLIELATFQPAFSGTRTWECVKSSITYPEQCLNERKELVLGKSIIFSSKKVMPAKHEHNLCLFLGVQLLPTLQINPIKAENLSLHYWPQIQLKHSPKVLVT